MATMATRMALGPAPKAGLGRWSTRGRRARLEVRCRTAAEKRIEAKRNQKQSQSASRADLLAKSKKTAKRSRRLGRPDGLPRLRHGGGGQGLLGGRVRGRGEPALP